MNPSAKNTEFVPLLEALKKIQSWLEYDRPPQIMLAAQTMEEFKSQRLPAHCRVRRRKIHGPRVLVRGRRQVRKSQRTLAYWPEDALVESTASMLIVVMDGEANIRIADYEVDCQPGDIILIPPRTPKFDGSRPPHEKVLRDRDCNLLILFHNEPSLSRLSIRISRSHNDEHAPAAMDETCWIKNDFLEQLFVNLNDKLQNHGSGKSTFYLLASLMVLLQEEIESGGGFNALSIPSDSPLSVHQDPIHHAMQYIQNHLNKPLSIDLVARWVGLSRTVFTERFRAEANVSFKTYLTRMRLERAKVLLCQSNFSIEGVSKRVGLTSGQLRNLFHQAYQCTPTEFRRSQKNGQN